MVSDALKMCNAQDQFIAFEKELSAYDKSVEFSGTGELRNGKFRSAECQRE